VRKLVAEGVLDPGGTIVCVLTGHGLKDPDTAGSLAQPVIAAQADTDAVRTALGW
jgi:threonine synthase